MFPSDREDRIALEWLLASEVSPTASKGGLNPNPDPLSPNSSVSLNTCLADSAVDMRFRDGLLVVRSWKGSTVFRNTPGVVGRRSGSFDLEFAPSVLLRSKSGFFGLAITAERAAGLRPDGPPPPPASIIISPGEPDMNPVMSEMVFFLVLLPLPLCLLALSTIVCCCLCCCLSSFRMESLLISFARPCLIVNPAPQTLRFCSSIIFLVRAICCSSNLLDASRTDSRICRWARYNLRLTTRGVFVSSLINCSISDWLCVCSGRSRALWVSEANIGEFSPSSG
mmetsp:Transcript_2789/g.6008  ORF Transcript_2789/g.6008 Transcript_2789/m.6008 type:complete len:282 (-) Transcript_2789:1705-2550(-)